MNRKNIANPIFAVAIVILAGALAYFGLMKKPEPVKEQSSPAPTQVSNPPQTPTPNPIETSEKQSAYNLFKGIVNWKVEDPAAVIIITHCADGAKHNPAYKTFSLSFGPGVPDTTPSLSSIVSQVKSALTANGWKKCTPNNAEEGDYYSNIGPWFRETYVKNGKLLQLNSNFSMGVGYNMDIQFEYSN